VAFFIAYMTLKKEATSLQASYPNKKAPALISDEAFVIN